MGMIGRFRRISVGDLERMQSDPDSATLFLSSEEEVPTGFDPFQAMDVEEAWHGIHYLLTGDPWAGEPPLNFIVAGGHAFGEDLGNGPPRGFTPEEVLAIAEALAPISVADLRRRYDLVAMVEHRIHPQNWADVGEDGFTFLATHFEELKTFILNTAELGMALVVHLT